MADVSLLTTYFPDQADGVQLYGLEVQAWPLGIVHVQTICVMVVKPEPFR
jgi:hypothetical protein